MPSPIPFYKYHALGNDYIVITPNEFDGELTPEIIRLICHRNYGIGYDGILYGPFDDPECDFALRIYNPDGSPAESKSGNAGPDISWPPAAAAAQLRLSPTAWDCAIKKSPFTCPAARLKLRLGPTLPYP